MPESQSTLPIAESQEEWKVITGFPEYEVSSLGRVRLRFDRGYRRAGYVLSLKRRSKDKEYVSTTLTSGGKEASINVHRLVAIEFLPAPAPGQVQVNHKNGRKSDNRKENLEWTSPKENQKHSREVLGNAIDGANNPNAKLSEEDKKQVREMRYAGISSRKIAKQFGVSKGSILRVKAIGGVPFPKLKPPVWRGENHHRATITEAMARKIKAMLSSGDSPQSISDSTRVKVSIIHGISQRKAWAHLDATEPSTETPASSSPDPPQ